MASPAEVANDMMAHAIYWRERDERVARVCREAERLIRDMLVGQYPDRRTYSALFGRLLDLESYGRTNPYQGFPDFTRARNALHELVNARRT